MRRYHVVVNGTAYEVDVEEVTGGAAPVVASPVVAPAPVAAAPEAPVAPAAPVSAEAGAGEKVTAPMPGTILKINGSVGQAVKSGDVIMVLEAMKMENEIMAPKNGTITSIAISEGASVDSGALLYTID